MLGENGIGLRFSTRLDRRDSRLDIVGLVATVPTGSLSSQNTLYEVIIEPAKCIAQREKPDL